MIAVGGRLVFVGLLVFLVVVWHSGSDCEAVQVSLTRKGEQRQQLLRFARERLGLGDEQKLPVKHLINSPFRAEKLGGNDTRVTGRAVATTLPLYGGLSLGVIYMGFTLGTPGGTFMAQVDTGSSDLGLPSNDCSSCGKVPLVYNPSQSSTSVVVPCSSGQYVCPRCSSSKCGYSISYADGSGFEARLYTDAMVVAGLPLSGQSVGAIYKETGLGGGTFEPKDVDGIIGLAYRSLSETNSPTFMDALVSQHQLDNVFTICTNDDGGLLELGGVTASFDGQPAYVPLRLPLYFYAVVMNDLRVGSTSLGLPPSTYNADGAIVDSGTTDLLLPRTAYNKIRSILEGQCASAPLVGVCGVKARQSLFDGYCYKMTPSQIQMFPTLSLVLTGGVTLGIPGDRWVVDGYCSKSGYYALAIDPLDENAVIMGDVVHRQYTVIYDRANSRVGFAQTTNCS